VACGFHERLGVAVACPKNPAELASLVQPRLGVEWWTWVQQSELGDGTQLRGRIY
jgi:hypothetical protein